LATLARQRARAGAGQAHALDRRIDACVYALFGLSERLVHAAERGFWGDRFPKEIQGLERCMSDPSGNLAPKEGIACSRSSSGLPPPLSSPSCSPAPAPRP